MQLIRNLGWLYQLRNDEHPVMVGQICTAIDNYSVVDERVNAAAARVKAHLEPLEGVKVHVKKDELSPTLRSLHKRRRQTIVSLQMQVRGLLRSPLEDQRNAAGVLTLWLEKHQGELVKRGYVGLTKRISQVVTEAENEVNVKEALTSVGLITLIPQLKQQNEEFILYFNKLLDSRWKKSKSRCYELRKCADKDILLLINTLNSANELSENKEEYRELMAAIKEILDYYRSLSKIKNRKETENNFSKKSPISESGNQSS